MIRTIYIVFSKKYNGVSWEPNVGAGRYAFLCNYDIVKKNDIIIDPRYSSPMLVTDITSNTNRVYKGITLKDIYITMVNGNIVGNDFDIDKQRNNMEKRNIKVTLDQAIEWFNSDNETLKALALTVYTKEELTLNLDYIKKKVIWTECTINVLSNPMKAKALADWEFIAEYFNNGWKKTMDNTGYFLGKTDGRFIHDVIGIGGLPISNIGILKHTHSIYPGITYFKNKEDLLKAVQIIKNHIKDLFL